MKFLCLWPLDIYLHHFPLFSGNDTKKVEYTGLFINFFFSSLLARWNLFRCLMIFYFWWFFVWRFLKSLGSILTSLDRDSPVLNNNCSNSVSSESLCSIWPQDIVAVVIYRNENYKKNYGFQRALAPSDTKL